MVNFTFQKIRSALVSKILPIVQGKCSLISAKVTFSASQATGNLDDLWLQVCAKRDECDKAMMKTKGMAFFFSSVAVVEKKANENISDEDKDGEDETREENSQRKKKIYWPAISYWIALQSQDGVRVSTIPVHSALLETEMEVTAKSLQDCTRGKEENVVTPLCTTVKDHNNSFLQEKVDLSFQYCLEKLQSQVLEEPIPSIHGSERVVRLQVASPIFATELQNRAIPALIRAGLVLDVFGIESASESESQRPIGKALSKSPVVVALNKIERAMTKLDYALYKGEVFKKNPASMFTFEHACSIRKFLSLLANNDHLKDLIVNNFSKVENFLADPECEFSRQLKVNYDLIEVSGGWCFSISERKFIQNGIKEVGKESPRAFVQYLHDKEPDAKFFKEILHNSLTPTDVGHFCEYFLRLLNHGIKPHKEKVLCLIGAPNSGKTSLFTPITRIVPARYVFFVSRILYQNPVHSFRICPRPRALDE